MSIINAVRSIPLIAAFVLFSTNTIAVAKQTSLDARIIDAFNKIDKRTSIHRDDYMAAQARTKDLEKKITEAKIEFEKLSNERISQKQGKQKRILHAKIIDLSSKYLREKVQLVESAANVIAQNLTELSTLSNDMDSIKMQKMGERIKIRIKENIRIGKSIRNALKLSKEFAQSNPEMAKKFNDLNRIAKSLDRTVTIDRAQTDKDHSGTVSSMRDKRRIALDTTINKLSNMYTQVMVEKSALEDLRKELWVAVQMGRLAITEEITAAAIPETSGLGISDEDNSIIGLSKMMGDLNERMLDDESMTREASFEKGGAVIPPDLTTAKFKNF